MSARGVVFGVSAVLLILASSAGAQSISAQAIGAAIFSNESLLVIVPQPPPIVPPTKGVVVPDALFTPQPPPIVPNPSKIVVPSPPPITPITFSCTEVADASDGSGTNFYASGMGGDGNFYFIRIPGNPVVPGPPPIKSPLLPGNPIFVATTAGLASLPTPPPIIPDHCGAADVSVGPITGAFVVIPAPPPI